MSEAIERSSIPANHGDAVAEYTAVREDGIGLLDLSARGRIILSGSEVVPFLNGLVSNDVKTLGPGAWMTAAFPNVQGRLLAVARVLNRGEDYLIDTEAITHAKVLQLLERFTLAGDFHVTDVTPATYSVSVQGAGASVAIKAALGEGAADVARGQVVHARNSNGGEVTVIRATHTAEDGFDLFTGTENAAEVNNALAAAGALPIGSETLEVLRIEAGIPRYGQDMDETTIVSETNLDEAVSFTKGCYIGQEIIARIKYRGHVAKKLAGVIFDGLVEVGPAAKISAADKEMGRITSVTGAPRLGRTIALAYVKYDFLTPGTSVRVVRDGIEHSAHIAELPFVRGSWYLQGTEF